MEEGFLKPSSGSEDAPHLHFFYLFDLEYQCKVTSIKIEKITPLHHYLDFSHTKYLLIMVKENNLALSNFCVLRTWCLACFFNRRYNQPSFATSEPQIWISFLFGLR